MNFDRNKVEMAKKRYPVGTRIRLNSLFCYGKLRELSWGKETIAYLHCLPDSLTAVRDIFLEKAESELEWKFQAAIWAIEDRSRRLGMVSELSM